MFNSNDIQVLGLLLLIFYATLRILYPAPRLAHSLLVALEGNISSGKSTLVSNLPRRTFLPQGQMIINIVPEKVSPALLKLFYDEYEHKVPMAERKYAFPLQITTQVRRINEIKLSHERRLHQPLGHLHIHDRSLLGDLVFALIHIFSGTINKAESQVYADEAKLENILEAYNHIDKIVYLHSTPERCLDSVTQRGKEDSKISIEYLRLVDELHFHGALYLLLQGKDLSIVDWEAFGDNQTEPFFATLGPKQTISIATDESKTEIDFDYESYLVPLVDEAFPLLTLKYRRILSAVGKQHMVKLLTDHGAVRLIKVKDSLLNVFSDLTEIIKGV